MAAIFSYHLSENLKKYLDNIDLVRKRILLTPLSPQKEIRLRWNSTLERIKWSLSLSDVDVSKNEIDKILSLTNINKTSDLAKEVIGQRKAFNYLKEYWSINSQPMSFNTIKSLYQLACEPTLGKMPKLTQISEAELNQLITYLQDSHEHPVIQAAIAQIEFIRISPIEKGSGKISRLLNYLFLYKWGYDCRDLLVIDEYFRRDLVTFEKARQTVEENKNLTIWLEYFAYGINHQLQKALEIISSPTWGTNIPKMEKLNNRQKEILLCLENPDQKITNRDVQKMFTTSQITASRDLTKLVKFGLLFSHGKGRSVYYIKA